MRSGGLYVEILFEHFLPSKLRLSQGAARPRFPPLTGEVTTAHYRHNVAPKVLPRCCGPKGRCNNRPCKAPRLSGLPARLILSPQISKKKRFLGFPSPLKKNLFFVVPCKKNLFFVVPSKKNLFFFSKSVESCMSCTDRRQVEIAFCLIPFQTIPPAGATSLRHGATHLTLAARIVRPRSAVAPPSLLPHLRSRTWIHSAGAGAKFDPRFLEPALRALREHFVASSERTDRARTS